jgi:hypothetical protein
MNEKKMEKLYVDEELQATVSFLDGLTSKIIDATRNIDNHANVLIGLNTGIFLLSINEVFQVDHLKLTFAVVAAFSALSAFVALLAIRLPKAVVNKKHNESLFYARRIASFSSAKEYAKKLRQLLKNEDDFFEQYSLEIYNLSKYYYIPKRRVLSWARYIFVFGVILSGLFLMLEKLHWFNLY